MTIISAKEFNSNQEKYFTMAVNEDVCIEKDNNMYHLMYKTFDIQYPKQIILEPDDNLRRGITTEELLEKIHGDIRNKFASRI